MSDRNRSGPMRRGGSGTGGFSGGSGSHRSTPYQSKEKGISDNYGGNNSKTDTPGQKERPSRTLFVRNINYNVPDKTIREMFSKHGEIKKFFNLIDKRGMAFVTYYDLRCAESAKKELQNYNLTGRVIDVHFAIPKEDDPDSFEEKNTGTLYVTVRNPTSTPQRDEVRKYFEQFGELREVRDCKNTPNQKFVEFHDLRDCEKAYRDAQGHSMFGGTLDIKYAFSQRTSKDKDSTRSPERRGGNHSDSEQTNSGDYGGGDYGVNQYGSSSTANNLPLAGSLPSLLPGTGNLFLPNQFASLTTPLSASALAGLQSSLANLQNASLISGLAGLTGNNPYATGNPAMSTSSSAPAPYIPAPATSFSGQGLGVGTQSTGGVTTTPFQPNSSVSSSLYGSGQLLSGQPFNQYTPSPASTSFTPAPTSNVLDSQKAMLDQMSQLTQALQSGVQSQQGRSTYGQYNTTPQAQPFSTNVTPSYGVGTGQYGANSQPASSSTSTPAQILSYLLQQQQHM